MKIAVAGGVTGGHIYPAVALIQKFQQTYGDTEVLYFATPHGLENREIKRLFSHAVIVQVPVRGLLRPYLHIQNLSILTQALRSVSVCAQWIRQFKPDFTLITGGYVSVPVGIASRRCSVPYYIHEQNAIGGVANRWISKKAHAVFISFEESRSGFTNQRNRIVFSGNPVRNCFADQTQYLLRLGIDPSRPLVLVVGGSQGSDYINQRMEEIYARNSNPEIQFMHSTGDPAVTQRLRAYPNVFPSDFIEDIHECMGFATMIISRGGATTVAEIVRFQVPALIIPWAQAAENHQLRNAQALFQQGGALFLEERDASADAILEQMRFLMIPEHRTSIQEALQKMTPPIDPTDRIFSEIMNDRECT